MKIKGNGIPGSGESGYFTNSRTGVTAMAATAQAVIAIAGRDISWHLFGALWEIKLYPQNLLTMQLVVRIPKAEAARAFQILCENLCRQT